MNRSVFPRATQFKYWQQNQKLTRKVFLLHPLLAEFGGKNGDALDASLFGSEGTTEEENIDGFDAVPIHVAKGEPSRSVFTSVRVMVQLTPRLTKRVQGAEIWSKSNSRLFLFDFSLKPSIIEESGSDFEIGS